MCGAFISKLSLSLTLAVVKVACVLREKKNVVESIRRKKERLACVLCVCRGVLAVVAVVVVVGGGSIS
jgi:hypothetical protein